MSRTGSLAASSEGLLSSTRLPFCSPAHESTCTRLQPHILRAVPTCSRPKRLWLRLFILPSPSPPPDGTTVPFCSCFWAAHIKSRQSTTTLRLSRSCVCYELNRNGHTSFARVGATATCCRCQIH
ncbi:hypothetical protein BCV70DRAFT_96673 [Testicularia cyperi]|uniref:Uncharacterized protein n=1 Tax=Testicularia cyperi TaxID=1882483 RepID=A0A317XQC9_9BASI|nr:hypothetical protein BCV70DRAFT_96673 [Testicularia cyperi]